MWTAACLALLSSVSSKKQTSIANQWLSKRGALSFSYSPNTPMLSSKPHHEQYHKITELDLVLRRCLFFLWWGSLKHHHSWQPFIQPSVEDGHHWRLPIPWAIYPRALLQGCSSNCLNWSPPAARQVLFSIIFTIDREIRVVFSSLKVTFTFLKTLELFLPHVKDKEVPNCVIYTSSCS